MGRSSTDHNVIAFVEMEGPLEESSWTAIIDDFEGGGMNSSSSCQSEGSSIVSDASSPAQWKQFSKTKRCKRLDFKKKIDSLSVQERSWNMSAEFGEDPFEDTASSPLNSSQVSGITFQRNSGNCQKRIHAVSEVDNSSSNRSPLQHQHRNGESPFLVGGNESTDLKKMGLCLVPVSMLVDYMG